MFLSAQPLWISIILLGVATMVVMLGPVIVRRHVELERLTTNNEIAGFKFATVGVLYAVLLGFAVIVVWEKFSDAEERVTEEGGASAAMYRLAHVIGPEAGIAISDSLTLYLHAAVEKDWPAMASGKPSPEAAQALGDLYIRVLRYTPSNAHDRVMFEELVHQLNLVTDARRARLVLAAGIVPGVIWLVLLFGAFLVISFTFFFGTVNLRAQVLMTAFLALLIFSALLIIIAIDRPFAGSVRVGPEPLLAVLEDLGGEPRR